MTDATKDTLDALCAEHVMGWKKINRIEWGWGDGPIEWGTGDLVNPTKQNWSPTRDANAAIEVWEKMRDRVLAVYPCDEDGTIEAWRCKYLDDGNRKVIYADTLPVAVVLAALRAKSVPLPETKEQ